MAEEEGEHLLLELVNFTDDESGAVWIPANDILVLLILNRNTQTSSISKVLDIKMEGLGTLYFLPRTPKLISSLSLSSLRTIPPRFYFLMLFYLRTDM